MDKPLSETTKKNYEAILNRLEKITQKPLKYILIHPKESLQIIETHTKNKKTSTISYLIPICKQFSSNHELANKYPTSYKKWRKYLTDITIQINNDYSNNIGASDKIKKVVTMDEISAKYKELSNTPNHQKLLLLSVFMNLAPKRADLGNVRIFHLGKDIPTDNKDMNFIYLGTKDKFKIKPFLQINKFKTAKHMVHGIREVIPQPLYNDILYSLQQQPREYLFVDSKGNPYTNNNSYSKFVSRTFASLFGEDKSMGVSLWRHVYVSTQMNLHTMSDKDIKDQVYKMGTSERQIKQVYKWINLQKNKETKNNEVCETICRPIAKL